MQLLPAHPNVFLQPLPAHTPPAVNQPYNTYVYPLPSYPFAPTMFSTAQSYPYGALTSTPSLIHPYRTQTPGNNNSSQK
jgi:hypothetical protein